MSRITTRVTTVGTVRAVFCDRARIGYVCPGARGDHIWEFSMRSEALDRNPAGFAPDRRTALDRLVECFRGWCRAAGLGEIELEIVDE